MPAITVWRRAQYKTARVRFSQHRPTHSSVASNLPYLSINTFTRQRRPSEQAPRLRPPPTRPRRPWCADPHPARSCSTASLLWCRPHASTATATSTCWRERPLIGNFRGDRERLELAELGPSRPSQNDPQRTKGRQPLTRYGAGATPSSGWLKRKPAIFTSSCSQPLLRSYALRRRRGLLPSLARALWQSPDYVPTRPPPRRIPLARS
jgi:hypothetical protein